MENLNVPAVAGNSKNHPHELAPLYKAIARTLVARENAFKSQNAEWENRHLKTISRLEKHLPHGSGFDSGCSVLISQSKLSKIVISAPFHHMDENGYYDGWNEYKVIVTPCLAFDFSIRIIGKDRNEFKDYATGLFHDILSAPVNQFTGALPTKTEICEAKAAGYL